MCLVLAKCTGVIALCTIQCCPKHKWNIIRDITPLNIISDAAHLYFGCFAHYLCFGTLCLPHKTHFLRGEKESGHYRSPQWLSRSLKCCNSQKFDSSLLVTKWMSIKFPWFVMAHCQRCAVSAHNDMKDVCGQTEDGGKGGCWISAFPVWLNKVMHCNPISIPNSIPPCHCPQLKKKTMHRKEVK